MRFANIFNASCFVALLLAGQARAQTAGDADAGGAFARKACSECHLVDDIQQERGNDGVPSFDAIANDPAKSTKVLRTFLQAPHGQMPDFILSRQEIENVVAYIRSLRRQKP